MTQVIPLHTYVNAVKALNEADGYDLELVHEFAPDNQSTSDQRLLDLIKGSRKRRQILMHWAGYPNLRNASEALFRIVGSQWERESGVPLILEAIEGATDEALRVVGEDGGGYRAVIGRYLNYLGDIASSIVLYRTAGLVKGRLIEWHPLAMNLSDWIAAEKVERVYVYRGCVANRDFVEGIKMRYLSQSCTPQDLGMAIRHR